MKCRTIKLRTVLSGQTRAVRDDGMAYSCNVEGVYVPQIKGERCRKRGLRNGTPT
jgi:hypothetical protein